MSLNRNGKHIHCDGDGCEARACLPVVREGGIAEDDSLAENDERVGLHPLDQFRAFQTLLDAGLPEEEIAARHFVTPASVKQRLRLESASATLHEV